MRRCRCCSFRTFASENDPSDDVSDSETSDASFFFLTRLHYGAGGARSVPCGISRLELHPTLRLPPPRLHRSRRLLRTGALASRPRLLSRALTRAVRLPGDRGPDLHADLGAPLGRARGVLPLGGARGAGGLHGREEAAQDAFHARQHGLILRNMRCCRGSEQLSRAQEDKMALRATMTTKTPCGAFALLLSSALALSLSLFASRCVFQEGGQCSSSSLSLLTIPCLSQSRTSNDVLFRPPALLLALHLLVEAGVFILGFCNFDFCTRRDRVAHRSSRLYARHWPITAPSCSVLPGPRS